MSKINQILLAIDFVEDYCYVAERAVMLAQQLTANLTLLHVLEVMPESSMGYIMLPNIQAKMLDI